MLPGRKSPVAASCSYSLARCSSRSASGWSVTPALPSLEVGSLPDYRSTLRLPRSPTFVSHTLSARSRRATSVPERTEHDGLIRSFKDTWNLVRPGDVLVVGDGRGDLIRNRSVGSS